MPDPKIKFDIAAHAEGGGEVDRLAASFEKLDEALDPKTAARAQALRAEIDRLGAQQGAVERFRELGAATDKAAADLEAADAAVAALRAEIAAAGEPTATQAGRLERLGAAAQAARADFTAQSVALEAARARLAALGIDGAKAAEVEEALAAQTRTLREQLQGLGQSLQGVQARTLVDELRQLGAQQAAIQELRDLDVAVGKARAGLASAEGALAAYQARVTDIGPPTAKQAEQQQRLSFAVDDARAKFVAQEAALDAAKARLAALGVETTDLAAAEERLRTAAQGTAAQLHELGQQQQAVARFAELAAATDKARADLIAADAAVAAFRAEIAASGAPTAAQTAQLGRLTEAAAAAKTAFISQEAALTTARGAMTSTQAQAAALAAETARTAAAADRMAAAWQTLGVRSFREVQLEAEKVRAALLQVQAASRNPAEINIATAAAQAKLRELGVELGAVEAAARSAGDGVSSGFFGSIAGITAALAGVEAFKKVLETGLAQTKLSAQLKTVFGDAQSVSGALGFVGETATDLGFRLDSTGTSFARLAASAIGTSLEGQKTRDVFRGVSEAAAALKLSGDEVEGVLLAVGQIMSKGTVQSEELKGQIGERLPGAFNIAARAMGVTTAELGKMLEAGQVLADDFLPKFAAELHRTFGPGAQEAARGLDAEFNRLVNTLSLFAREIAGSGLLDAVTAQVRNLAQALREGLDSGELQQRAAAIGQALSKLVEFLGSAAEWALKFGDALVFVAKVVAEGALIQIGLTKLAGTLGIVGTASAGAAAGVTALGAASASAAAGVAATGTAAAASAARVGLLGTALRLLPAGISIALAVEGLPAAGKFFGEFAAHLAGVDRDLAAAHQRRIDELDGEIRALETGRAAQAQYADLTLKSRAQLVEMSAQSREAYAADLEGAVAAAGAAAEYARRQQERVAQEKELAKARGASTEELASYGRQESAYAVEAQKATDQQAELRKELGLAKQTIKDVADGMAIGLTPAASEMARTLGAAIVPGKDLEETLKKIAKAADLGNVEGIQTFGLALRKLADDGKLAPEEVRRAWQEALGKISGEELQRFATQARAAFGDTARDSAAMADVVDAQVRQAFKGLKLDFEQFSTGVSSGTRGAVADLDLVAQHADQLGDRGARAGDALRKGFAGAISGARTAEDLDLLGQRIDEFAAKGLIAANRAEQLRNQIDAARLGMGPLGEAAKAAGVDIGRVATGVSASFRASIDAIDDLGDGLAQAGRTAADVGPQLEKALDQKIAAAATREELDLVAAAGQGLAEKGLLAGSTWALELGRIKAKALELSPAFQEVQDAAGRLGVALRDKLVEAATAGTEGALAAFEKMKGGTSASTREVNQAFANMAAEVVAKNRTMAAQVVDANGNMTAQVIGGTAAIVPEWLKVEAATRGAVIEIDNYGNASVRVAQAGEYAGQVIQRAMDAAAQAASALWAQLAQPLAARNAGVKSVLGSSSDMLDAGGNVVGKAGTTTFGGKQLTIPEGYYFDQAAFARENAVAQQSGRAAPDPSRFIKKSSGGSGTTVSGSTGAPGSSGVTADVAARQKAIDDALAARFMTTEQQAQVQADTTLAAAKKITDTQAAAKALADAQKIIADSTKPPDAKVAAEDALIAAAKAVTDKAAREKALADAKKVLEDAAAGRIATGSTAAPSPAPAPAPTVTPSAVTRTIEVRLRFDNGSASLYGTESEASAFLRQLEDSKRSAGY